MGGRCRRLRGLLAATGEQGQDQKEGLAHRDGLVTKRWALLEPTIQSPNVAGVPPVSI
jgi:hypothetical protein